MPELIGVLARVQARWKLRSILWAIAIGGVVFALTLMLGVLFGATRPAALWAGVLAGVILGAATAMRGRAPSAVDAALLIERTTAALDNLVVTAAELAARPRPVRSEIREAIERQAAERVPLIDVRTVVPLGQPLAVAVLVITGGALLAGVTDRVRSLPGGVIPVSAAETLRAGEFTVTISPPAYLKRSIEVMSEPVQVSVIAGSRVRIEAGRTVVREWVASASEGIEIRPHQSVTPRFLSVIVVPDAPPQLRIVAPGKDIAMTTASGTLAINIESRDDLGLASLALQFTKASGGGENVAFTEGDVPLTIERRTDQQWLARATLPLETMGLVDGDLLVYRAVARDINPQGTPVQSEQYLVEIGKNAVLADAGFALPAEEKKYAISQQMVIYKTQQLLAAARRPADFIDQTRAIAIEQRMVRAEVVFLGGGEVQDEVEEAAASDELTEGRLQNTGRAEMLKAINAMSRAEAQLNEGHATEALVFERQALASLERALDRRRYFLRTLPDRSRIDVARRLSGERREARNWLRDQASIGADTSLASERALMRRLALAAQTGDGMDASLAAAVAAIDPSSRELQQAAVAIASANSASARLAAVQSAMAAVTTHVMKTLAASTVIDALSHPLAGQLADELRKQ